MNFEEAEKMGLAANWETPETVLIKNEAQSGALDESTAAQLRFRQEKENNGRASVRGLVEEHLFDFLDLMTEKPEHWKVLKVKLRNPHASKRHIGAVLGKSHTTVSRYLREIAELLPDMARILGVN
jgi:hypothetical protein